MKDASLPDWAEMAICSQGAEKLRPRLVRRWREIEMDVLPAMNGLDDIEKTWVLDCVLYAGKYWQKPDTERHRKAWALANDELYKVAEEADNLATRLNALRDMAEKNNLLLNLPMLPELIEETAKAEPGYADWLHVMKTYGHFDDFFRTWNTQSRSDPDLAMLLQDLALRIFYRGYGVDSLTGDALNSRERTTDSVRILLKQLGENLAYPLRMRGFTLPDQAIATLASILFDLDPPPTADAIKQQRKRKRMSNR